MTTFENLEQYAFDNYIYLQTHKLPNHINGYYYANLDFASITLSSALETTTERCCVLAEELGHHHTTSIDLFTAPVKLQRSYERRAATWAANALLPPVKLVKAWRAGVRCAYDLAEYCDVTEQFVLRSMDIYASHYEHGVTCDGCLITFDLLHIQEVS